MRPRLHSVDWEGPDSSVLRMMEGTVTAPVRHAPRRWMSSVFICSIVDSAIALTGVP